MHCRSGDPERAAPYVNIDGPIDHRLDLCAVESRLMCKAPDAGDRYVYVHPDSQLSRHSSSVPGNVRWFKLVSGGATARIY